MFKSTVQAGSLSMSPRKGGRSSPGWRDNYLKILQGAWELGEPFRIVQVADKEDGLWYCHTSVLECRLPQEGCDLTWRGSLRWKHFWGGTQLWVASVDILDSWEVEGLDYKGGICHHWLGLCPKCTVRGLSFFGHTVNNGSWSKTGMKTNGVRWKMWCL